MPTPTRPPGHESAPRGVVKLASCDGCQLTLLDLEDQLLALDRAIRVDRVPRGHVSFASEGPYDVLLVEGSVSTPEQPEAIVAAPRPDRDCS